MDTTLCCCWSCDHDAVQEKQRQPYGHHFMVHYKYWSKYFISVHVYSKLKCILSWTPSENKKWCLLKNGCSHLFEEFNFNSCPALDKFLRFWQGSNLTEPSVSSGWAREIHHGSLLDASDVKQNKRSRFSIRLMFTASTELIMLVHNIRC